MPIERALSSLLASVAGGRRDFGFARDVSARDGPYLVINRISAARDYALGGSTGYIASRFQIDAYAETHAAARAAAAEVIGVVDGFRGSVQGTRILGIFIESERDLSAADAGQAEHLFRRSVDLIVHHGE